MANSNLILGPNWDTTEWPDCVTVTHCPSVNRGPYFEEVSYVPERTCTRKRGPVRVLTLFSSHKCGGCGTYLFDDDRYCPSCGAKVVE